jgi:hypothetical protein
MKLSISIFPLSVLAMYYLLEKHPA